MIVRQYQFERFQRSVWSVKSAVWLLETGQNEPDS